MPPIAPRASRARPESDQTATNVSKARSLAVLVLRHRVPDPSAGPTERRDALPLEGPRSRIVDFDYLNRRMTEERQRAASADHDAARRAHLQLAEHYRQQIERLAQGDGGPLTI